MFPGYITGFMSQAFRLVGIGLTFQIRLDAPLAFRLVGIRIPFQLQSTLLLAFRLVAMSFHTSIG